MITGYAILNDPDVHLIENSDNESYITSPLQVITPFGFIEVPAGEVSDLASIPWIAQIIIPKTGKYNRCARVHDYIYKHAGFYDTAGNFHNLTRKECDEIYLGLMEFREVPEWNRETQYYALRFAGYQAWRKYRKKDKSRKNAK